VRAGVVQVSVPTPPTTTPVAAVPPNSTVVGVPGRVTKQDGRKIDFSLDHIHVLDPLLQEMEELRKRIEKLEKE
jgi:serine O-acetyltransferase